MRLHTKRQTPRADLTARDSRLLELAADRVVIENVQPAVDGGLFPAKVVDGRTVTVSADVFCDGHDIIDAQVLVRPRGARKWTETWLSPSDNDRWSGEAVFDGNRMHEMQVRAWRDPWAWFVYDLAKKHEAGVPTQLELREGRNLLEETRSSLRKPPKGVLKAMGRIEEALGEAATALSETRRPETVALMREIAPRRQVSHSAVFPVWADREKAAFSAWYELFPRSTSGSEERHGTFRDVEKRLPYVKDLGFDVLYFPPIHPIGTTNRKGKNNSLVTVTGDVGVPYAIGSRDGGHESVHPELGTIEDFDRLVEKASEHGLEIALELALNASPDHPWIEEHPEWFEWRPDGSIRFAENPPKKYEDIVNFHYYDEALPGVWHAFLDVFLFWAKHGVTIFRVDNPHTKPFPFWQWLIEKVQAEYPGAIFLAEAFTRPKVMRRLAKVGFNQSYTYFTWRNERWEIEEYVRQLVGGAPESGGLGGEEMPHVYRPNFFTNTPDINPPYLQTGGAPAHKARLVLAATLAGNYGIYNGFELCIADPVPGREEYLDSEKYQLRAFDFHAPGHIKDDVRRVNKWRREHPALQVFPGHMILDSNNENVIVYARHDRNWQSVVVVAVNLDPFNDHGVGFDLPLWKLGLSDDESVPFTDLVTGAEFEFHGKWQTANLPKEQPYWAWALRR